MEIPTVEEVEELKRAETTMVEWRTKRSDLAREIDQMREEFRWELVSAIDRAESAGLSKSHIARLLGISRPTLYALLER